MLRFDEEACYTPNSEMLLIWIAGPPTNQIYQKEATTTTLLPRHRNWTHKEVSFYIQLRATIISIRSWFLFRSVIQQASQPPPVPLCHCDCVHVVLQDSGVRLNRVLGISIECRRRLSGRRSREESRASEGCQLREAGGKTIIFR